MTTALHYLSGFNNQFETEAISGALPVGQFNPQKAPLGLYTEQFSSTAFTAPRAQNRRTWFYRKRPSVCQSDYQTYVQASWTSAPEPTPTPPSAMRWSPLTGNDTTNDFIDGVVSIASNGSVKEQVGIGIAHYGFNLSMKGRAMINADAEMLFVPHQGELQVKTECGCLTVAPGEIMVIPRGMKFSIDISENSARGYLCENYGHPLTLPERGPVGANGFANDRDFQYPVAWFEESDHSYELITKFSGHFYRNLLEHSPFDVVAWAGNSAPYKYDLSRFNVINTVSFDHPDPSIFTVLTSPSYAEGTANLDFVIFPPRWMVAEHTFRPPWFHRNVMSEFMGLIEGVYDAKEKGFEPGGFSLHNAMTPHGPEQAVFEKASNANLKPERYENTLAFMFESRYVLAPTAQMLNAPERQLDYPQCWAGLESKFTDNNES
ncbi:homogentisate 1,2-dioxygenase [Reinekea marina]|uniref:Homogentisate 1,2-dioxygenase n=1 Tax=Reinekea marina TaxID=1310421 RepID=A0ABV7WV83_9GAMM|nr:homogentisate 1,2-dioxygenase [Reinekea marina]MDN3650842.1 homogentisate 1,2-dioxygenase [Reinekea marina]